MIPNFRYILFVKYETIFLKGFFFYYYLIIFVDDEYFKFIIKVVFIVSTYVNKVPEKFSTFVRAPAIESKMCG